MFGISVHNHNSLIIRMSIDENLPDLSGIPDFLFVRFLFSGYGHRLISGSLNFIKNIFPDLFCQAILIYDVSMVFAGFSDFKI